MEYLDKKGEAFWVREGGANDIALLLEMYIGFHPKGLYQGLPPSNVQTCSIWIRQLFASGVNLIAGREGYLIGHAAVLPDTALRDCEYLVFVHQNHRGRGIGTAMTRLALASARDLGLGVIWLTVDAYNFIAIRLYRKCGFRFADEACRLDEERKMVLSLVGDRTITC